MAAPPSLLAELADPATAEAAASALLVTPGWLTGPPPPEVLAAAGEPSASHSGSVVGLVRAWSRPDLVPAVLAALRSEVDLERRRRLAWTMKQVCTEEAVPMLLALATSPAEDRNVRVFAIEAVTRCTFGDADGWTPTKDAVGQLITDPDPWVRSAATALAGLSEGHDGERRAVLLSMLDDPDDLVVVNALAALPRYGLARREVAPPLAQRLLDHPNPHVSRAAEDLFAAAEVADDVRSPTGE